MKDGNEAPKRDRHLDEAHHPENAHHGVEEEEENGPDEELRDGFDGSAGHEEGDR